MNADDIVIRDADGPADPAPADDDGSSHPPFDENESPAPVVARPMIPISMLVARPGNVRRDLAITDEFVESVKRPPVCTGVLCGELGGQLC